MEEVEWDEDEMEVLVVVVGGEKVTQGKVVFCGDFAARRAADHFAASVVTFHRTPN